MRKDVNKPFLEAGELIRKEREDFRTMSDKELKITEERVRAAAEKCGTAKEILKELFPDVFKVAPPGWEDVTLTGEVRPGTRGFPVYIIGPEKANFQIKFHDNDDCFIYPAEKKKDFMIFNGRIWRKREA